MEKMAGNKGQVNMFPDFETLATHFDEVLTVLCRKCSVFFLFFFNNWIYASNEWPIGMIVCFAVLALITQLQSCQTFSVFFELKIVQVYRYSII